MTTLNDLIRLARHSGQLMAEDKTTGVRVLVKRGPLGWRVECYIDGTRKNERAARRLQDGEL
jgi:hypothetical protein